MSNYWNLLCRDCDDELPLDINHGNAFIKRLIEQFPLLITIEPVLDVINESYYDLNFPTDWVRYAKRHVGHDLIPIDEYGKHSDSCGEYFHCKCCPARYTCNLLDGHEGEHARERA